MTVVRFLVSVGHAGGVARPNILLIVSEDNGPELGCYGDPYAETPVLDRLVPAMVRKAYAEYLTPPED